jgi:cell wall-associated NlpC family hydrolase
MKKVKFYFGLFYVGLLYVFAGYARENFVPYYAMVGAPIVEAVGGSIAQSGYKGDPEPVYRRIPLAAVDYRDGSCARLHQLLLHEIVKVEQEEQYEVKVALCSTYYQLKNEQEKRCTFWVLKKNIIPLAELPNTVFAPEVCLPTPISYQKRLPLKNYATRCVTLLAPYHDAATGQNFSAGTRFAITQSRTATRASQEYEVYAYDPEKKDFVVTTIPAALVVLQRRRTHQEALQLFVRVVRAWAHLADGVIPYVWGGCSFVHFDSQDILQEQTEQWGARRARYFVRPGYDHIPKTGLDCSGLVLRAAQIAGLPYYFKNTTTLESNLKPLAVSQQLENGDLMFFPGHVVVITDVENNLCVEARGYASGYGKVQEISIDRLFLETKNFEDLVKAYHNKRPLTLLARSGDKYAQVLGVKLLKLASIWNIK